ncbi:hypothetical protein N9973_00545 [bacterium]|nr:hypothetical protein [bacterium]
MTSKERKYARLQDRKDAAEKRFENATTSIKQTVNSSFSEATDFFEVAREAGVTNILMSASAVSSANEHRLLRNLTPDEGVAVYAALGALMQGKPVPEGTPQKIALLAQIIGLGYQLSSLPTEDLISPTSSFDLQIQPDGSVKVAELPPIE